MSESLPTLDADEQFARWLRDFGPETVVADTVLIGRLTGDARDAVLYGVDIQAFDEWAMLQGVRIEGDMRHCRVPTEWRGELVMRPDRKLFLRNGLYTLQAQSIVGRRRVIDDLSLNVVAPGCPVMLVYLRKTRPSRFSQHVASCRSRWEVALPRLAIRRKQFSWDFGPT